MKTDVCMFKGVEGILIQKSEFDNAYENAQEWCRLQRIILSFAFVEDADYDFTIEDYNAVYDVRGSTVFISVYNKKILLRVFDKNDEVQYERIL